jgi:glycosyltransferase involved in cell wall biosynthesis
MSLRVAVVTPTIGSEHLFDCTKSVRSQTYKNLTHYLFIDGKEYVDKVKYHTEGSGVKYVELEENVGKGWYGHRVYAACSFLVNADVICYLDEDNWYEPCHVEKLVAKIEEGNDWAYSLRKIYDKNGEYVCEDNCESLGKWPVYFNSAVYHIDTSSFAVKRDVAVQVGHSWYGQWGADRKFFHTLQKYFPNFSCTKSHTLCYRLDGNPKSVTKSFFERGNASQVEKYQGSLPWKTKYMTSIEEPITIGPGIQLV